MNEVIRNMVERRTIRRFRADEIDAEAVDLICQAAVHAPSAGGRQGPVMVVCQDAEINDRLGKINRAASRERVSEGNRFISREQPSILDDTSIQNGFYGAPCVITLFAPQDFAFSEMDCACMAENIMLAAHSLGVGSCFVSRARETFQSDYGRQLQEQWGIAESYRAFAHVSLGYPSNDTPPMPRPRKEGRVVRVESPDAVL